jgi:large subunit ribosomal protein L18
MKTKIEARLKRKASIRGRMEGSLERPRLSVFRSAKHVYAQIVDDGAHRTLAAASTLDGELEAAFKGATLKKVDKAKQVGALIAKRALAAGIDKVVFDRNGFIYHGRVAAIAQGAREGGLKF